MTVSIDVIAPAEDVNTCIFRLDRPANDGASEVFGSASDAAADPLARRMFAVPGVASVLVKGEMLLVSRSEGAWPELVEALKGAIAAHFDGAAEDAVDEQQIWDAVWALLDAEINPAVAGHGGSIELVEVKGTSIRLHMGGGCQGCGMAAVTLREGVERRIREVLPQVTEILDATDHEAGQNPYFPG